jgi:hypothetical protein
MIERSAIAKRDGRSDRLPTAELAGYLSLLPDCTLDLDGGVRTSGYVVTWREFTSLIVPDIGRPCPESILFCWIENLLPAFDRLDGPDALGIWTDTEDRENRRKVFSPVVVRQSRTEAMFLAREARQRYIYDIGLDLLIEVE